MKIVCYSETDQFGIEQVDNMGECVISLLLLKRLVSLGMKPKGFSLHVYQTKAEEKTIRKLLQKKYKEHIYMIVKAEENTVIYTDPQGLIFLLKNNLKREDMERIGEIEGYKKLTEHIKKEQADGEKSQQWNSNQFKVRSKKRRRRETGRET